MNFVFIFLVLVLLKCLTLYRVYHLVPPPELKRRARAHDPKSAAIYKVMAHGPALDLLLWLVGTASATTIFIMAARSAWWIAVATIVLVAWLLVWAPKPRPNGWLWNLTAWSSPYTFKIMGYLTPMLNTVVKRLPGSVQAHVHSGFYEKEDLIELLISQSRQGDNRISKQDLEIAKNALTFGDKKVSNCMTAYQAIRFVGENEAIGPMLMDELHATGFSLLPVVRDSVKSANPNVTGTLYIKDLVDHQGSGKVRDIARRDVQFINEVCTLHQALDAIAKKHHHLLIVVNNFEEVVGVLTLEDVIKQILGAKIIDEFDKYDDLRAVAALEAKQDHKNHNEVAVAPEEK